MATHWTEFPHRVEKFGDLFNIFETLEHDLRANVIHSGSCAKESAESAYEIDFLRRGDEFVPRTERIPGWEVLATYTERNFGVAPSVFSLRMVRGAALGALDASVSAVNEMTVSAVVAALEGAARQPAEGESDLLLQEYRLLKVGQVAKLFNLNPGQVSKHADAGTFVNNGKTGHDRRIDVLSVVKWELARLARQNSDDVSA